MSAQKILGSDAPVETSLVKSFSEKETVTVTIEGPLATLEKADAAAQLPSGYAYDSHTVSSSGDGMGKLTVKGRKVDDASASSGPVRTTFAVDMAEVTYDLITHPHVEGFQNIIEAWLATDPADQKSGNDYQYKNSDGETVAIEDDEVIDFCVAYEAGIRSYVRYFPVIEKISTYRNPPGMSMSGDGKSFTGGSPTFSSDIGTFSEPPLTLNGYQNNSWLKTKDSWLEGADKSWKRTEQWTCSAEVAEDDDYAWIYDEL